MRSTRFVLHVLVAALAWVVFGLMWWWAFRNAGPTAGQVRSLVVVVAMAVLVAAATGLWVAWNVRVWNRGDRRHTSMPAVHDYSTDSAGRAVDARFSELVGRRYIVIDVVDDPDMPLKRYTAPGMEMPTDEEVASCVA